MAKIMQKALVLLIIAITLIMSSSQAIYAISQISSANLVKIGQASYHLKYYKTSKGMYTYVICDIVGYRANGTFYPAYCLNNDLDGVGKTGSYTVDVTEAIKDEKTWRVAKNGYPNKTGSQMGLENDYDAYVVTKMAIYCITGQSKLEFFTADANDKEGQAMLAKLKELVNIGINGGENPNVVNNVEKVGEFTEDGEYYSQKYKLKSNVETSSYTIKGLESVPNETIVTDESGNIKTKFNSGESFKIKIPKKSLNQDIKGKIKIEAESKTYPILYGKTRIAGTQNYLLTGEAFSAEEAEGEINLKLNTGKIEIKKTDSQTEEPIQGVTFALINEKGETIQNSTTDEYGRATFMNLYQGNYRLKEIATNENYVITNSEFEVSVQYNEKKVIEIQNERKRGNLKIYKIDKDNNNIVLGNVEFDLYSEELKKVVGTYLSDVNGEIYIENLRVGEYKLIEKSTNQWYNLAKDTQVKIKWNETEEAKIENELKKGQIKVIKQDKDNNEYKIAGVEFEVLDENMKLLEKITTNEEGVALSQKYPIRDYKKIILKEVKTDERYELKDEPIEIELKENEVTTKIIENEKKKGKIKVIKQDKDNNEILLEGVCFDILNSKGEKVGSLVTNEKGEAESCDLPIDEEYKVVETKTLENYVLEEESQTIKLQQNQISELKFENEKKKGKIRVVKKDADNKKNVLSGVEFEVINSKGQVVETITTNSNGEAITKELPVDEKYMIRETKTLENYVLTDEIKTVTIKENEITSVEFYNKKIKGKIKIIKTSSEDNVVTGEEKGTPLANVKFEIYDESGNVVDEIVTDENGIAISKELEKGRYIIKEIETKEGYILNENEYAVNIRVDGQISQVEIKNEPENPGLDIEKTGDEKKAPGEEIKYNINIKNTGNVALENFVLEDKIDTEKVILTKIETGTYNQNIKYDIWYKTNLKDEYVLFMEDLNGKENYNVDFTLELQPNEYITSIKFDLGTVGVGFSSVNETHIYAKVKNDVKSESVIINNATLMGYDKDYLVRDESSWSTEIYKILPLTGF